MRLVGLVKISLVLRFDQLARWKNAALRDARGRRMLWVTMASHSGRRAGISS